MIVVLFLIMAFLGYVVGRISHIVAHNRNIQFVHHWVSGLTILILGLVFFHHSWKIALAGLGLGLVISDLNDMLKLRLYGVEKFEKQKFWGIK